MRRTGSNTGGVRHVLFVAPVLLWLAVGAWAQVPQVKLENPGVGHNTLTMGMSSAIDGNTLIVGAPGSPVGDVTSVGTARVYISDGQGGWILQAELTASDGASGDAFGTSVGISGDTAVVGAVGDDDGGASSGSAYVFVRSGGVWTEQKKLTASDAAAGDNFGNSISISADTVVVGAYMDGDLGTYSGSAYVFTRSGGLWTQQQKLNASDGAASDVFGRSVGVSIDTVIVGADGDDDGGSSSGSAYVFTRSGGVWTEQIKLGASDAAASDYFGNSVAISGDTAVVGAYGDDDLGSGSGSAYVFTRSAGIWSEQQKLLALDGTMNDQFGFTVALSGDTAIAGAPIDNPGGVASGSAYVFTRSGSTWAQQQKLSAPDAASQDQFGWSVAVSGDSAVVGAWHDDVTETDSGSAYVFTRSGTTWSEAKKLTAYDTAKGDQFGSSVCISGDTAIVGTELDDGPGLDSGGAFVFIRSGAGWTLEQKLTAPDWAGGDHFGSAVAVEGDTAIVGARWDDDGGTDSGSAYVFVRANGIWTQEQKLVPSDPASADQFGVSVAISGDTAIVGSYQDDDAGSASGSAYVFTRSGGVWTQQQKLTAGDAAANDMFGFSVSISGDTAIIGARSDDLGTDSGSAYVFTRSGGIWAQQPKIIATDGAAGDLFGVSVSISADTAVIGASYDDDAGTDSGSAYVFTRSGGVWTRQQKITGSDIAAGNHFGNSVALTGDTAVIGASYGSDGVTALTGTAYVFTRSGSTWTEGPKLAAADAANLDSFGNSVSIDTGQVAVGAYLADAPEKDSGAAYVFEVAHPVVFQTDGTAGATLGGTTSQLVFDGDDATPVTATAPASHHFVSWTQSGGGTYDNSNANPLTVQNVTQATTLTAVFAINQYTLTYAAGSNGSINGDSPQTVDYGQSGTAVTAVPDTGYSFVDWSDSSTQNPRTDTAVTADVDVTANFADLTAPVSNLTPVADRTLAGTAITLPFTATDTGSGVASTALWVQTPGAGSFVASGLTEVGTSGAFSYTAAAGDGVYAFATKATDNAANAEPDPTASQVEVIVNTVENSDFTWTLAAADSVTTYPMTDALDVLIALTGATPGGSVTVSRTAPLSFPGGPTGWHPDNVLDESLTITASGLGTGWTATLTWPFDPTSDDALAKPLNAVFRFDGGLLQQTYPVTPSGTTLVVPGITSFSDWYAGNVAASGIEDWTLMR